MSEVRRRVDVLEHREGRIDLERGDVLAPREHLPRADVAFERSDAGAPVAGSRI